jgi:hypothetical protein
MIKFTCKSIAAIILNLLLLQTVEADHAKIKYYDSYEVWFSRCDASPKEVKVDKISIFKIKMSSHNPVKSYLDLMYCLGVLSKTKDNLYVPLYSGYFRYFQSSIRLSSPRGAAVGHDGSNIYFVFNLPQRQGLHTTSIQLVRGDYGLGLLFEKSLGGYLVELETLKNLGVGKHLTNSYYAVQSNAQTNELRKSWLDYCTHKIGYQFLTEDNSVVRIERNIDTINAQTREAIKCLFSGTAYFPLFRTGSDFSELYEKLFEYSNIWSYNSFVDSSFVYDSHLGKGEALVAFDDHFLILSESASRFGIVSAKIMETSYGKEILYHAQGPNSTNSFLFSLATGKKIDFGNGVTKPSGTGGENFIVQATKMDTNWKGGRRIWFDKLVDRKGKLLDIVTKKSRISTCVGREKFQLITNIVLPVLAITSDSKPNPNVCFETKLGDK